MTMTRGEIETRVVGVVAEALDQEPGKVQLNSSLVDDLGAESIDFIDIGFRIETAFGIKVPADELWKGTIDFGEDPATLQRGLQELRAKRPDLRWDRLPAKVGPQDLPRLITVATVVEYLERRLASPA